MTKKLKVLIADDHLIVASGIKAILDSKDDFEVIGIAENGLEVLEVLEDRNVDIVLMDINMPEMNGIDCTKKVKAKFPRTKVIILTMYNRKQFVRELLHVGADGCILKSNTGTELLNAIDRVMSGNNYFDQLNQFIDAPETFKAFKLSEREIEIIELIGEGCTSKEIARRLYISEHTVKTHRKNIFRKTEVNDADQLIEWAMNHNML